MAFKKYIVSVMKDERIGLAASIVKVILLILSWVYGLGIKLVDLGYASGFRKRHKAGVPVVSIGNITLGGTGKTPFTIYVADYITHRGKKCAVLTRGYGNDEYKQIRDTLQDVKVFVSQDRVKSAEAAYGAGNEIIVMDDGFQHRRLKRDLEIVLLDGRRPFGNGKLFPRGILREPLTALKRADIFVITKVDNIDSSEREKLIGELEKLAPEVPIITARHKAAFLKDVTGAIYSVDSIKGLNACLVSGIVDPKYFAKAIKDLDAHIGLEISYGDHHQYSQKDIINIYKEASNRKCERIIVTEKDYVKLRELDLSSIEDKLFVLNISIEIESGKEKLVAGLNSIMAA